MLFFSFFVQSDPALLWNRLGPANGQPDLARVLTLGKQGSRSLVPQLEQGEITNYHLGMGFAELIGHQLVELAKAQNSGFSG